MPFRWILCSVPHFRGTEISVPLNWGTERIGVKEQLKTQIIKCFDNRDMIAEEHRDIFDEDPVDLCSRESLQYLQSWINTYYTVVNYSKRQQQQTRQMMAQD